MSQAVVRTHVNQRRTRATVGAYLWLVGMVGLWTAFGPVALTSVEKLSDLWAWVPVVAEVIVWIGTFPWILGVWVSQTS